MAKGAIKKLVSPWQDNLAIERNGVSITLVPVELDRGEGKYLGLSAESLAKLTIEQVILWTAKNVESGTGELGLTFFKGKLVDLFNSAVFRNAWRGAVENIAEGTAISDETKKSVVDSYIETVSRYFNEDTSRERAKDASFYRKKAAEVTKAMVPFIKKAAGDIKKNLTADEIAKVKALRVERDGYIQLAEQKEREEMAALEQSLDIDTALDAMDADDDDKTPLDDATAAN